MAKRIVVFFVAAVIGLWVQGSVMHTIAPSPSALVPDLILILVVYIGLHYKKLLGLFSAFFLGICLDFASGQYVGPCASGMVLAFYSVVTISEKVFAERILALFILTITASFMKSLMYLFMLFIYVKGDYFTLEVLTHIGLEALFTAIFAPFVIMGLRASDNQPPVSSISSSYRG